MKLIPTDPATRRAQRIDRLAHIADALAELDPTTPVLAAVDAILVEAGQRPRFTGSPELAALARAHWAELNRELPV